MKPFSRLFFAITLVILIGATAFAQDDNPFLLKRGDNEFGFWAGFSPKATTIFEGLRDDEVEDRKLFVGFDMVARSLPIGALRCNTQSMLSPLQLRPARLLAEPSVRRA